MFILFAEYSTYSAISGFCFNGFDFLRGHFFKVVITGSDETNKWIKISLFVLFMDLFRVCWRCIIFQSSCAFFWQLTDSNIMFEGHLTLYVLLHSLYINEFKVKLCLYNIPKILAYLYCIHLQKCRVLYNTSNECYFWMKFNLKRLIVPEPIVLSKIQNALKINTSFYISYFNEIFTMKTNLSYPSDWRISCVNITFISNFWCVRTFGNLFFFSFSKFFFLSYLYLQSIHSILSTRNLFLLFYF